MLGTFTLCLKVDPTGKKMSLADRVIAGEIRAAARLMRDIDDNRASAITELKQLYPSTGKAFIIGITGPPGAGKSTMVDQLTVDK